MTTRPRDLIILAVMPLFFVSNLIIGRPAVETVPPFTLAALRWGLACLILAPIAWPDVRQHAGTLIAQWKLIALLGFLGMWICGAIVYVALQYTTATHGTLIYTASPVIVVLLARFVGAARIADRASDRRRARHRRRFHHRAARPAARDFQSPF